jgi:hypothetical protein
MKHELVHRLTHVGPSVPASLPGRGLRRARALARVALYVGALVVLLAVPPLALAVAVAALVVDPMVGWLAVLVTVAVTTTLARRLTVDDVARA